MKTLYNETVEVLDPLYKIPLLISSQNLPLHTKLLWLITFPLAIVILTYLIFKKLTGQASTVEFKYPFIKGTKPTVWNVILALFLIGIVLTLLDYTINL